MQKKQQGLDYLLKRVSVNINKSPQDIQPFFKILKTNWYEKQQDLQKLSIQDYQRMKIPHRVAQAIMQQLNPSKPNQIQKNNQPRNKDLPKQPITLNETTMSQLTHHLCSQLLQKMNGNKFETRSVLQIIYKIITNIVKDPYQIKFRTLKKKNNLIQQNIVTHEPCFQFIKSIGFEDSSETLQLNIFEVPQLIFLQDCLNQAIVGMGGTNMEAVQKPVENMFLDVKKFPVSQSAVKQQFSQQKLSEMKYVDALEKLVEIRNKMMAEPPKDRRLRIYHKRFESKDVRIAEISFEEQFEKSDDQSIVGYWKQIISNNMKSQKFQSKRKLQFEYLIKQKIHKQTLIKVKLPNELIIQAYFGPLEKLREVFKLVAQIVIGDLYLFTAPPKKIMDKQLQKTLLELDSVPQGSFYLAQKSDIYYIQKQYVPYIQQ